MSTEAEEDRIFKALAAPIRRKILDELKKEPQTTGQLCDSFPQLDRCTIMLHLKVLGDADLVIPVRRGRERWNYLNAMPIRDIHNRWIGPYAAFAAEGLSELKRELER
jgi:DNA-binding transcriptional ArsR family regulator